MCTVSSSLAEKKEILNDMNEQLADALKILQKSKTLLGEDDPFNIRLASAITSMANAQSNVNVFVDKGDFIEEF